MLETNKKRQESMDQLLRLRYPAVALKLIENEADVLDKSFCPMRDTGKHIALCQAFALARRQRKHVFMRKEDHWCWNPLITYGHVNSERGSADFDAICNAMGGKNPEIAEGFVGLFPRLPYQKYDGVLLAPLDEADFEPDVLLIYCKNDQLRLLLMAINTQDPAMVESSFTPLDSCAFSVIPAIEEGKYRITLPDPGEYERAFTPDDDIILSVPYQKYEPFFKGVAAQLGRGGTINSFYPMMKEDFARPPFYNVIFEGWGLGTGDLWEK